MNTKIQAMIILSLLAFTLIAAAGISSTAFVNLLAQEGVITPKGSVNDTLIDKDKGTSRSSTEFSAVNDTMSGQNASQWVTNATLAYAQGEGDNTGGMPGGEGMTGGGGMSAETNEMPMDEGVTVGGGMSEDEVRKTEDLENETGGMTEGQTDPNGEVDLGTGGP